MILKILILPIYSICQHIRNKVLKFLYYAVFCQRSLRAHGKACIINPKNITMGKNCSINPSVYINAMNTVRIGNNVTLSAGCSVISASLDIESFLAGGHAHVKNQGINIGNNVWIGANATILGGKIYM